MNNVYFLNLQIIPNNYECKYLDAVIDYGTFYTLEEAISYGIHSFKSVYMNNCNVDKEPTIEEMEEFISKFNIEYRFIIHIVSGNRKRFNNSKELMEYFNDKISNVPNEELFDFLLTLISDYYIVYDYNGNKITGEADPPEFTDEDIYAYYLDFSPESCKNGIINKFDFQ